MRLNSFQFLALGAVGALALLAAKPASAAISTSFSTTPVTDVNAIADDPQLAGRLLNLMNVDVGGNDWTNSVIRIELTAGSVYNAVNAVGTDATPAAVKPFWTTPGFRNGPFDTFVNMKGQTAPINDNPRNADLLGAAPPELVATGLTQANATVVSASWGVTLNDLQNPGIDRKGLFSVGRFTLSADAVGSFSGFNFDTASNGVGTPFNGNILAGTMFIPEPTSLGLLGLAAVGFLRRRRAV